MYTSIHFETVVIVTEVPMFSVFHALKILVPPAIVV